MSGMKYGSAYHKIGGATHPGLIGGCAKCKALRQDLELSPTRSLLDTMFETMMREFSKSIFDLVFKEALLKHPEVREGIDDMGKVALSVTRCSKFERVLVKRQGASWELDRPKKGRRKAKENLPGDAICKKCGGPYWCHLVLGKAF